MLGSPHVSGLRCRLVPALSRAQPVRKCCVPALLSRVIVLQCSAAHSMHPCRAKSQWVPTKVGVQASRSPVSLLIQPSGTRHVTLYNRSQVGFCHDPCVRPPALFVSAVAVQITHTVCRRLCLCALGRTHVLVPPMPSYRGP